MLSEVILSRIYYNVNLSFMFSDFIKWISGFSSYKNIGFSRLRNRQHQDFVDIKFTIMMAIYNFYDIGKYSSWSKCYSKSKRRDSVSLIVTQITQYVRTTSLFLFFFYFSIPQ